MMIWGYDLIQFYLKYQNNTEYKEFVLVDSKMDWELTEIMGNIPYTNEFIHVKLGVKYSRGFINYLPENRYIGFNDNNFLLRYTKEELDKKIYEYRRDQIKGRLNKELLKSFIDKFK